MGIHGKVKLLKVSLVVSISGSSMLYLAAIFADESISARSYIAFFLIVYSAYTLDRIRGGDEDKINRQENSNANKAFAAYISFIAFFIALAILILQENIFPAILPVMTTYLYSKEFKICRTRINLKKMPFMKNFVVAFIWSGCVVLFLKGSVFLIKFYIFAFFFIKVFINTVIYDFRDIRGDRAAGLETIPIVMGEKNGRRFLLLLHFILYIGVIYAGIKYDWSFWIYFY